MENLKETFEVNFQNGDSNMQLQIRQAQTTDGIPIYHCYLGSSPLSELRQDSSGEWTQLWGDLPFNTVQRLGEAIANRRNSTG